MRLTFAAYFALAKHLSGWFTSPKAAESFHQSAHEHDNYRAALQWGLENEPIESVLRFVNHLFVFWLRGGYWQEGERWMKTAVAQAPQEDSAGFLHCPSTPRRLCRLTGAFYRSQSQKPASLSDGATAGRTMATGASPCKFRDNLGVTRKVRWRPMPRPSPFVRNGLDDPQVQRIPRLSAGFTR